MTGCPREHLANLCENKKCRVSGFSPQVPTRWEPTSVINPETGMAFTEQGAWWFVAARLRAGEEVEEIDLDIPPGKTGYVMKIDLDPARPPLYVKLHLGGSGKVFGRSFHYSER